MNARRGLFRLWIVGSCAWIIGWLGYVWLTCTTLPDAGGAFMICHTSLFYAGLGEVRNFTFIDYGELAFSALIGPVAVLAIGLIAGWVADGFRASGNSN